MPRRPLVHERCLVQQPPLLVMLIISAGLLAILTKDSGKLGNLAVGLKVSRPTLLGLGRRPPL